MNQAFRNKWACCVLAAALLAGCSRDPQKRKAAYLASGQQYAQKGRYQEAVIQFRNAIEIDPRFAAAHYQLGLAYLQLRNQQEAYRAFAAATELDPQNPAPRLEVAALLLGGRKYAECETEAAKVVSIDPRNVRAHALLGQKHTAVQEWEQGIREFETAVELDPMRVENYAGLAYAYSSGHRNADAEAALRRAVETQPKSAEAYVNLGRFYGSQHRLAEAAAAMRAAATADPHATIPLILLAKIYMDAGKPSEAARVSEELKVRAPDDPAAYGALAAFYEATGQAEKAAGELKALAAAKPKDLGLKAHLTDILLDLNRVDEAWRLNEELLSAAPGDPRALSSKGRILITRQQYADAKKVLDAAVEANPQSAWAHYFLGISENLLGLPDLARLAFSRALELSPELNDAAIALADLHLRGGDYDEALRLSNRVIQKNPNLPAVYITAARALLGKGKASEAETQLRPALDRDPASTAALGALLDIDAALGKTEDAIRRISAQASQNPRNARLEFLLGVAYLKVNDLVHSEAAIQQAIALDPGVPDGYGVLAEISRARGSWDEAVSRYQAAIAHNPKRPETYMALSGVYDRKGESRDAIGSAERARELDPASPYIANNLAYLYLEYGGDPAKALALAEEARRKLPNSAVVFDTIGWAHYMLRAPDAAVAQLSESVRREPTNPVYRYHLGMAYIQAGRLGEAARSLQQALSINARFANANDARAALERIARGPA